MSARPQGAALQREGGREDREPALRTVEQALRDACGITLSEGLRATLTDALARAARDAGQPEAAFLARLHGRDPAALTTLVEASVIGETYFFRHPEQFEALRGELLLGAPLDRPLQVWSAGCATGEEAYSLAMALLDAGRTGAGDRILATDVSARALAVAREGVYGEWSMRRVSPAARARHFEQRGPLVAVRAEARAPVAFDRHNLVRDPAPASGLDLVVCRNVLIYFTAEAALEVAKKLAGALRPGGLLVLGPVESSVANALELERLEVAGAMVFRRPEPGRPSGRPKAGPRVARSSLVSGPLRDPTLGTNGLASPQEPRVVAPAPVPAPTPTPVADFAAARDAARRGELALAETLAREVAVRELSPESYLLLSMAADARGDVAGAVEAVRRALYLDPGLAMGHAALVPLYGQLGLADDAARARRNALEAIRELDDAAQLRGVEPVTAGALRSALGGPPPSVNKV
ncbi:MAG: protein-glutamate O-methyltransferase CheR [Anaeromyxobacteraceae bacterium]